MFGNFSTNKAVPFNTLEAVGSNNTPIHRGIAGDYTSQNKTSFGADGVSNVLLKVLAPYIIKPLYKMFNRSIRNGTVPAAFKIAKVINVNGISRV